MKNRRSLIIIAAAASLVSFIAGDTAAPYTFPRLQYFPVMPVNTDNPVTKEGAMLGRFLFYDPILSRDSTFSCSSCHQQSTAFSGGSERFSKGIDGIDMKRNTPALFNLAWYSSYFWDGRAKTIEDQVYQPVRAHDEMDMNWKEVVKRIKRNEMYRKLFSSSFPGEAIDSVHIAKALGQFERTLLSYNSKYDRVIFGRARFTADELDGFILMNDQTKGNCLHCHTTDANILGTTGLFSNNGLDSASVTSSYSDKGLSGTTGKESDAGKFQIPSLRNIAVTSPYMHDGRFSTLDDVLQFYSTGVNACVNLDPKMGNGSGRGAHLTSVEQQHIIAFLKTMTDSVFLTDTAFGNPFKPH